MSTPIFSASLTGSYGQGPALSALVRSAEDAGFDLFSAMDHPYGQAYEAYAALGYLLGRTERIGAYVGVTNLPLRPAPMLARTVATLSDISGGRFVLALGAGGMWEHITRMGVEPKTPGEAVTAMADAIELVRDLTGGPGRGVTTEGSYPVQGIRPAPVPTPPIWTGSGGPRSLRVTGRLADGWIPQNGADWLSARVREGRPIIDEAAVAAGREPSDIATIYNFGGVLAERDLPRTRDEDGRWVGGSPRQWVEELTSAVREYGASGFNGAVADESGAVTDVVLARFGDEVIAPVRVAVAS